MTDSQVLAAIAERMDGAPEESVTTPSHLDIVHLLCNEGWLELRCDGYYKPTDKAQAAFVGPSIRHFQ